MMNTPLMGEQELCMPFPLILDFWTFYLFLLRKPRDRLADVVTFWMWLLKDRLLLISTPRYFEPATDSSTWHWLGTEVLDLVICITTRLIEFDSIPESNSHRWRCPRDRGLAAETERLLSWRLPSKWPCHPQTTVPLTLFYQGGHLSKWEKEWDRGHLALWNPR